MAAEQGAQPGGVERRRLLIAVVLVSLLAVALATGALAYWLLSKPDYPWLFQGAYAVYRGETVILTVSVRLDVRLEVVRFNSTHAELRLSASASAPVVEGLSGETRVWFDLENRYYIFEGEVYFESSREAEVYLEDLGFRRVVIQEYEMLVGGPGLSLRVAKLLVYLDKEAMWPLKMVVESGTYRFELTIVESNIPGLLVRR